MLKNIADGVWVHTSSFLQSNTTIVQGNKGLLLIDPGITEDEMAELAADIKQLGQPVVAGFSTHPHWDHLLWLAEYGNVPRYGTARGKQEIDDFFASPDWQTAIEPMLPADIADEIPVNELFGKITALPAGTAQLSWDGPTVQIIEHAGHAAGSAALLIKDRGVLVAGDMLSDVLIPFFELEGDAPLNSYMAALATFEGLANEVRVFVPGHGSVGDAAEMRTRIARDRSYVEALRDNGIFNDQRLEESPNDDVHAWHLQQIERPSQP